MRKDNNRIGRQMVLQVLVFWYIIHEQIQLSDASSDSECNNIGDRCKKPECLEFWWRDTSDKATLLAISAVLLFLATFPSRIIVRLVIFSLVKIKFIKLMMTDLGKYCTTTTSYIVSASLVWGALAVAKLDSFFCNFQLYIWGIFFLVWLYSLFTVLEMFAIRRFGGPLEDFSKKVIITESVKLLRMLILIIVAALIYLRLFGRYQEILLYSIFGMVGLTIALGSVAAAHNALGGLYLVFHAPFKVDDFIEIGTVKGTIQRVALRYTAIMTLDGTATFIPNSFFLFKPMVNYSQRPKRQLEIFIHVVPETSSDTLKQFLVEVDNMLKTLHIGLTSHNNNLVDFRIGGSSDKYFFVAMDEMYKIRVYSYTEELDVKRHAMIKSEVWLAITEIMEDLNIEMLSSSMEEQNLLVEDETPFAAEFGFFAGVK